MAFGVLALALLFFSVRRSASRTAEGCTDGEPYQATLPLATELAEALKVERRISQ